MKGWGNWARHILPPGLLNLWGYGTNCSSGVQKNCLPHCWGAAAAAAALYSNIVLAMMQVKFLTSPLSHHVCQRCMLLLLSPSSRAIHDWRALWRYLRWRSCPFPGLITTRYKLNQFLFPVVSVCHVCTCFVRLHLPCTIFPLEKHLISYQMLVVTVAINVRTCQQQYYTLPCTFKTSM